MIEYLTQNEVKVKRGWSLTMIDRFMPTPCKRDTNHIKPYFPQLKLYRLKRIEAIEDTNAFKEAMIEKQRRSARMRNR